MFDSLLSVFTKKTETSNQPKSYEDIHMNYVLLITNFISIIKAVEAIMPNSPGKEKFDLVLLMITEIVGDVIAITPQLKSLATILVNGYRTIGVFTKKPSAESALASK